MKDVVVIGGPNGAGKTTSASVVVPEMLGIMEFVNADEIARGLSPFNPEAQAVAAGRLMLTRMRTLMQDGESFAFETTCAGRGHVRTLQECRSADCRVTLIYLWLPSPDIAVGRVARRVAQGGHYIPEDVIRRRYSLGLRNMLQLYLPVADVAYICDNSDERRVLIAEQKPESGLSIYDRRRWKLMKEAARD